MAWAWATPLWPAHGDCGPHFLSGRRLGGRLTAPRVLVPCLEDPSAISSPPGRALPCLLLLLSLKALLGCTPVSSSPRLSQGCTRHRLKQEQSWGPDTHPHTCTHPRTPTYAHSHMHVRTHVHTTSTNMHTHTHTPRRHIRTHTFSYAHAHIHAHDNTFTRMHTIRTCTQFTHMHIYHAHTQAHTDIHTHAHTPHTHAHSDTYTCRRTHTYTCTCTQTMHTHTYMHMHNQTHTHMHTHTCTRTPGLQSRLESCHPVHSSDPGQEPSGLQVLGVPLWGPGTEATDGPGRTPGS